MAGFRYRAFGPDGRLREGVVESVDMGGAVAALRAKGVTLVSVAPATNIPAGGRTRAPKAKVAAAASLLISELAILLRAGLPLDRALGLAIGNIESKTLGIRFAPLLADVREGRPLSEGFARLPDLFTPTAVAMAEAGAANGRLSDALSRLAEMMDRAAELRRLITGAMIYPVALLIIAVGVVLLMLLLVVPQFESLMSSSQADLPAASRAVLGASRGLRDQWLAIVLTMGAVGFGLRFLFAQAGFRLGFDRLVLGVPLLGAIAQRLQIAQFARTLGALVEGRVSLPAAVGLAHRTITNRHMGLAIGRVAEGVREGAGLAGPLAAARVAPEIAIGFIRTGEESSELGLMLNRLADVLDRDVRLRIERLVAILTPLITVVLGAAVTGIIAAIMSAILGFNELAVTQ